MIEGSSAYHGSRNDMVAGELVGLAWKLRWALLAVVVVFTVSGWLVGTFTEKKYRAEVLVSPVSDAPTGAGGGLGMLASQYGELASLAGVSLSGHGGNNKDETFATLQSALITEGYIKDNDLLPVLYPGLWDENTKTWKVTDPKMIPTLWKANQAFKKIRDVKLDKTSGLTTLRISWRDPAIAAKWANDLVKRTNLYLRDQAIRESERNVTYLAQEAATTNIVEAKAVIYSLLKEEVNKQMIAKGRDEYALKVIDPAQVPETPSTPPRSLLTLLGFVAGLMVAAIIVFTQTFAKRPA